MTPLIGGILGIGGQIIKRLFPDPKEAAEAELRLLHMQQTGELRELEIQMSAIIAEANSKDPWTSRARPTFLYVMYTLFGLIMVGAILGIWYPIEMFRASENMTLLFNALPAELYALFGAGYLGYAHYRSGDKRAGVTK